MNKKSRGMIEAEISEAMVRFEKDYMGRGPMETRAYIIEDMILVRLKGVLTRAEEDLTRRDEGLVLVKQLRIKMLENARGILDATVAGITGCLVRSMHTDISTATGERVIIFILDKNLEEKISSERAKKD
jgi:uncharacterized protein YbcI